MLRCILSEHFSVRLCKEKKSRLTKCGLLPCVSACCIKKNKFGHGSSTMLGDMLEKKWYKEGGLIPSAGLGIRNSCVFRHHVIMFCGDPEFLLAGLQYFCVCQLGYTSSDDFPEPFSCVGNCYASTFPYSYLPMLMFPFSSQAAV